MLFDEAIIKWQEVLTAGMRAESTIKGYRITLNLFRKFLETGYNSKVYLEEIKGKDLESYFKHLKSRNNKTDTARTHQVRFNAFFKYAHSQNWIEEDISKAILKIRRINSRREYLTFEEVENIIKHIEKPLVKTFCRTVYYTGLRLNEALRLTINDVDLKNKIIFVKNGKGGKNRRIPIADKLAVILLDYLENIRTKRESSMFFATGHTGKVSEMTVTTSLRNAVKECGYSGNKKITVHTFRHSFASSLVKKRVSIKVIQELMGHSDIKTTAVYLNASTDDMAEAVNEL